MWRSQYHQECCVRTSCWNPAAPIPRTSVQNIRHTARGSRWKSTASHQDSDTLDRFPEKYRGRGLQRSFFQKPHSHISNCSVSLAVLGPHQSRQLLCSAHQRSKLKQHRLQVNLIGQAYGQIMKRSTQLVYSMEVPPLCVMSVFGVFQIPQLKQCERHGAIQC